MHAALLGGGEHSAARVGVNGAGVNDDQAGGRASQHAFWAEQSGVHGVRGGEREENEVALGGQVFGGGGRGCSGGFGLPHFLRGNVEDGERAVGPEQVAGVDLADSAQAD